METEEYMETEPVFCRQTSSIVLYSQIWAAYKILVLNPFLNDYYYNY